MSAVVYRFRDADGVLLYVGATGNLVQRLEGHDSQTAWFDAVSTVEVEHFATRADALAAEKAATRDEGPLHNINNAKQGRRKRHPHLHGVRLNTRYLDSLNHGLTLTQLASLAGLSQPYLSNLRSGSRLASRPTAARLAAVLGVDAAELFAFPELAAA